jgi:uroporphyrinogen-III synthase
MTTPSKFPLTGTRILVTRARHQAGQLTAALIDLGAEVIEIPAIEILPPDSFGPLDATLRNLQRYQWLIVTSANTIRFLCERLAALGLDAGIFSHLKIAAIGSATAHSLRELGLEVALTPEEYVAESLLAAMGDSARNTRVLIARAAVARDTIPETLTQTGAHVDVVDAYQTVIPAASIERVAALFSPGQRPPDAATFTSSSTVTNFFHLLHAAGIARPPAAMHAISIGPITSGTLRDHRWEPTTEADPHDIPGLITAITRALSPDL